MSGRTDKSIRDNSYPLALTRCIGLEIKRRRKALGYKLRGVPLPHGPTYERLRQIESGEIHQLNMLIHLARVMDRPFSDVICSITGRLESPGVAFGLVFRSWRLSHGLSLGSVADRIGYSRTALYYTEIGRRRSLMTLSDVCEALNTTLSDIIADAEKLYAELY